MPRPTTPQICLGTFTVVASTVALLAVSGAAGVLEVAVVVGFALALGTLVTLVTLLSVPTVPAPEATPTTAPAVASASPAATAAAAAGQEYARQH
ncbi:hypothetical protein ACFVHB_07700 [Kitasatospora sp. NPDC127111]|uniref:hypothetical protein n=1 Tax=Kitasatospora sp. NPDC127111 TaxID=3345363 RepID=UPI00363818B5